MFGEVPLWATARKGSSRDSTTNWQNNFNFGFPKKKRSISTFFLRFEKWYETSLCYRWMDKAAGMAVGRGEGEGNGHWHLFTVFDNCSPASFCWATIWLKGYATLIVPFCGQSQQDRATICLPFSLSISFSLCKPATVAHRSYFMWLSRPDLLWLPAGTFLHPPLSCLPALSLFICVDAQKG